MKMSRPFASLHVHTDINECDDQNGGCEDACMNTESSYFCTCRDGLHLSDDGHSCLGMKQTNSDQNHIRATKIE